MKTGHHKKGMNGIYLIIGGNMGQREDYLEYARQELDRQHVRIMEQSLVYETQPWGNVHQPAYLNQVLAVNTKCSARQLLQICLKIEQKAGRYRQERYAARTLDIDLLLYQNQIISEEGLQVPHPQLHLRRFVLIPLCELAPHLVHPTLQCSMFQLLQDCPDNLEVIPLTR